MNTQQFKSFIKAILPPILVSLYRKPKKIYGFFGDYTSWEEALADSTGYDSDVIFNKVKDALLQVRDGKAIYERDSVLFDHIEYSFPVLAALLKVALKNDGKLSVLDFGGSLGSSYYQCKDFLADLNSLCWNIVEQYKFVECGKKYFENDQLKFYSTIGECLSNGIIDVVLISGVIQYLKEPYELIQKLLNYEPPYIIFDITAMFSDETPDRLTVQKVTPLIYDASYPAWILNRGKILNLLGQKYDVVFEFDSFYAPDLRCLNADMKGFFLRKKY